LQYQRVIDLIEARLKNIPDYKQQIPMQIIIEPYLAHLNSATISGIWVIVLQTKYILFIIE